MEEPLLRTLNENGYYDKRDAVFIQSLETSNLKELSKVTRLQLVQLIDAAGRPYDFVLKGDPRTYADLVKPAGLDEIAKYADGVGVNKNLIFPRDAQQRLMVPTTLIRDAHKRGLLVHGWTFRAENTFLPADFRIGTNPILLGDLGAEAQLFLKEGMDGFFSDHPGIGNAARDTFVERNSERRH
jgi:glycerophosphoryl diester phosphodiesterase